MRQFLACLLIFLGLGLAFSTKAESKELQYCKSNYEWSGVETNKKRFKTFSRCQIVDKRINSLLYNEIQSKKRVATNTAYPYQYFIDTKILERAIVAFPNKSEEIDDNKYYWKGKRLTKEDWCKAATSMRETDYYKDICPENNSNKESSQITKDYSWFAVVRHLKTNKEFIATNVSNEKDAKRIAISKCYKYVSIQLNKRGYSGCYVYLTVDANENIELAKEIISKQDNNKSSSQANNNTFNGVYKWNGKVVSKEVFCSNAEAANMPKYYPEKYILMCKTQTQVTKTKPDTSNEDRAKIEEEKKKIAEEKRKIEEEKRKIAEAKKKQEEEAKQRKEANAKLYIIGSGTGFFVSAEGHIVSNDHVVGICRKVASKIDGEIEYFNIIKTDEVNDLGIIKGEYKNPTYLSIKPDGAEYGEDIVAFGYPLADALSTSVKLTRGIVSSLSGPGNNYSEIQIDAAIQPGNSGGPVLNMEGQVVGVASSGLNKLYMLEQSEYIPENVNFAVAAPTLSNFLKANGVKVNNQKFKINNTKELARIGRPATLQLFCMNTKAVFEELKQKKKHSDVLFEKVIDLR